MHAHIVEQPVDGPTQWGDLTPQRTQWGCKQSPPTTFELSVVLLTRDPARAASWLDRLPIKLPPGPSLTGAEAAPVPAQLYPSHVTYTRQAPHAPFTYGRAGSEEREAARAHILGANGAGGGGGGGGGGNW